MSGLIAPIVAVIIGVVGGGAAAFGLVSSQTATPPLPDAPYVVYGNNTP